jgi:2-oxoglutarate ferredoxin oxidoreductase subunit gamma
MSTNEITIAGFGGQGILLMGQLMAYAANKQDKQVSWLPSYGPEMRGGTANCMVVLSDKPINSPLVLEPTSLIAMNKPSLEKFEPKLRAGGYLLINKDMVDRSANRNDVKCVEIAADTIAQEVGSDKVANMVALGCFIGFTELVSLDAVIDSLKEVLPPHRHNLIGLNEKALKAGYEVGKNARTEGEA